MADQETEDRLLPILQKIQAEMATKADLADLASRVGAIDSKVGALDAKIDSVGHAILGAVIQQGQDLRAEMLRLQRESLDALETTKH